MRRSTKKYAWIIENTPTILFFALWRSSMPLDQSAWVAAVAALCVLGWLCWAKRAPDTILLGINLHFALTVPVIQIVYWAGFTEFAVTLIRHAGIAVPVLILLTGICLSVFTPRGFLGCNTPNQLPQKLRSALLLLWAVIACVWSFSFLGNQILSVGLPVLSIFLMRRLLSSSGSISRLLPMTMVCLFQPTERLRRVLTAARSVGV